jgi:caffeoyl-CoA O-methyltransferase
MSEMPTLVTAEHFQYIAERTARDDQLLIDLKAAAAAEGLPRIWITPEQASFIQILLQLAQAREVVEVGTLGGYSAIWMARALPEGGHVRTIEVSSKHAAFAARWVSMSDVAGKITVRHGSGKDLLPKIKSGSADAVFLDADQQEYPLYLQHCLRILRGGGLIISDNAFGYGKLFETESGAEGMAVREFNDLMAREPALHGVIIPLGDGLWVAIKK